MNYAIHELVSRQRHLETEVVIAWSVMDRHDGSGYDAIELAKRTACAQIAREFADHIVRGNSTMHWADRSQGRVMHLETFAHTRAELVRLLSDAYALGVQDTRLRRPVDWSGSKIIG